MTDYAFTCDICGKPDLLVKRDGKKLCHVCTKEHDKK